MTDIWASDLFAVDGGGTSCRFAVLHRGQRHDARLGSANVSTDRTGAIRTLREGIARLCDDAGIATDGLGDARAYLGLAGVMSGDDARIIADAVPIGRVVVADDRMSTVEGALGGFDGGVIAVGTGSFVARRIGGVCRFVGGWGPALGDEASGAWLGRALLAKILRAADGVGTASDLTDATLATFDNDLGNIVRFAASATARAFAEFAPRIVAAASAGDPVARALMETGGGYLADALEVLGWRPGERLCLLGGLGRHYTDFLGAGISITDPLGSALDGALILAARIGTDGGAP